MADFSDFWNFYPRKVARLDAQKAWKQVKGDEIGEKILAGLKKQLPTWTDAKFIPYPASWLRAGRWDDELRIDVRPGTEKSTASPLTPWGQMDNWRAMMNSWIFGIIRKRGGVEIETLRKMIRERNRLCQQCHEMWGPAIPAERDIEVLSGMMKQLEAV